MYTKKQKNIPLNIYKLKSKCVYVGGYFFIILQKTKVIPLKILGEFAMPAFVVQDPLILLWMA